ASALLGAADDLIVVGAAVLGERDGHGGDGATVRLRGDRTDGRERARGGENGWLHGCASLPYCKHGGGRQWRQGRLCWVDRGGHRGPPLPPDVGADLCVGPMCMDLSEHLFRRESVRLVAALTRIFGVHNLALAEDVVQDAFCRALEVWKVRGVPDNPSAW